MCLSLSGCSLFHVHSPLIPVLCFPTLDFLHLSPLPSLASRYLDLPQPCVRCQILVLLHVFCWHSWDPLYVHVRVASYPCSGLPCSILVPLLCLVFKFIPLPAFGSSQPPTTTIEESDQEWTQRSSAFLRQRVFQQPPSYKPWQGPSYKQQPPSCKPQQLATHNQPAPGSIRLGCVDLQRASPQPAPDHSCQARGDPCGIHQALKALRQAISGSDWTAAASGPRCWVATPSSACLGLGHSRFLSPLLGRSHLRLQSRCTPHRRAASDSSRASCRY